MSTKPSESQHGAIDPGDKVRSMFGRISKRYDLMNHIMTGGMDIIWRKALAKEAVNLSGRKALSALDVATGTGDIAFELVKVGIPDVTGLDYTPGMIEIANEKGRKHTPSPTFIVGDGMNMPFPDGKFDAITISFGLRNMPDYQGAVNEMARVCASGGKVICLELTPFKRPFLKPFFTFYFEQIVPILGFVLSGDYKAYKYLPTSVRHFPAADELADMYRAAGLTDVRYTLLGMGAVALHIGTKP